MQSVSMYVKCVYRERPVSIGAALTQWRSGGVSIGRYPSNQWSAKPSILGKLARNTVADSQVCSCQGGGGIFSHAHFIPPFRCRSDNVHASQPIENASRSGASNSRTRAGSRSVHRSQNGPASGHCSSVDLSCFGPDARREAAAVGVLFYMRLTKYMVTGIYGHMNILPSTLYPAIAHETRLRCLLLLLEHDELCVCELTHAIGDGPANHFPSSRAPA